jgi:hypothetical protein
MESNGQAQNDVEQVPTMSSVRQTKVKCNVVMKIYGGVEVQLHHS